VSLKAFNSERADINVQVNKSRLLGGIFGHESGLALVLPASVNSFRHLERSDNIAPLGH
jgi:hypothetical protein